MTPQTHKRPSGAQTEPMDVVVTYQQYLEYCNHIEGLEEKKASLEERKASLGNICLISAASTIIPILGFVGYQAWLWVFVFSAVLMCLLFGVWSARR